MGDGYPGRTPDPLSTVQPLPSGEKPKKRLLFEAENLILDNAVVEPVANARNGTAVRLNTTNSSITMKVLIEEAGYYAVQVRHSNSNSAEREFRVYVNNSPYFSIFRGSRGGSSFTMDAVAVVLLKGMNTLKFSSDSNMDVDCVILERLDQHPW
jgi:hypothetical protein